MKRYISLLVLGLVFSAPAFSAEWGVGVSARSNDMSVYFPIKASATIRLEPYVSVYRDENNEGGYTNTSEYLNFGVGVFTVSNIKETTQFYYGARVGYFTFESESKNDFELSKTEGDKYSLAPAFGFEYFVTENISLGGEAAWQYVETSAEVTRGGRKSDWDATSSGTSTRLILRYFY